MPAVTYGGPDVPPDQPSSESAKIAESLVLIQFFADLAPESDLLPQDALGKAKVRFFLDAFNKIQPNLGKWANGSGSYDAFFEALDAIQDQLPPVEKGKYIFGDKFTLADIAVAPFLGRALLISSRTASESLIRRKPNVAGTISKDPSTREFVSISMILLQGRAGNLPSTRLVVTSTQS